jgi:hypothetical protein
MIKRLIIFTLYCLVSLISSVNAQTPGTLNFTFTPTSHSGYQGTKNVLAVWIQSSTGAFVKTKLRYAGNSTKDHLPTWAVNAGGSSTNCLSSNCNVVGATTGATLSNFASKIISWDGTDKNGLLVADGVYKVTIQETWNHGSAYSTTVSYTFTKGPNQDIQTPANDANFTNVALAWNPSGAGVEEDPTIFQAKIFPNPSTSGIFTINSENATQLEVYNLKGEQVLIDSFDQFAGAKTIDLSAHPIGTYFVYVTDGKRTSKHKIEVIK